MFISKTDRKPDFKTLPISINADAKKVKGWSLYLYTIAIELCLFVVMGHALSLFIHKHPIKK